MPKSQGRGAVPIFGNLPAHKRPVQRTLLHFWLKQHGISRDGFAKKLGCTSKMVDHYCDGQCVPGLAIAFQIEKVTQGAVSAATWLGTDMGKMQWEEIQRRAKE
jgi:transcriptional regulator with XRE-family HTH domain